MKHKLTLFASVVVIAGSLFGSVVFHTRAVANQTAADARIVAAHTRALADAQIQARTNAAKVKTDEASISKLLGECQLGIGAYKQLTPFQRAHLPAPVCSR